VKVSSRRVSGLTRAVIAVVLIVAAVIAGSGFVPSATASASIAGTDVDTTQVLVLAPVEEPQKTVEVRQPSGLDAIDAGSQAQRTPTYRTRVRVVRTQATSSGAPLVDGWRRAKVSWYGPGFIGNTMAGGGTLQWDSMVVAHRSLPFGTVIEFSYNGTTCTAVVRDRGPYVGGRVFDLGPGTAAALGFSGVGTVDYRILY